MKQSCDYYYKFFTAYLLTFCESHEEVFEEGSKMRNAIETAIQHAAAEKWYGAEEGEK